MQYHLLILGDLSCLESGIELISCSNMGCVEPFDKSTGDEAALARCSRNPSNILAGGEPKSKPLDRWFESKGWSVGMPAVIWANTSSVQTESLLLGCEVENTSCGWVCCCCCCWCCKCSSCCCSIKMAVGGCVGIVSCQSGCCGVGWSLSAVSLVVTPISGKPFKRLHVLVRFTS